MLDVMQWSQWMFGRCDLGDVRRTRRWVDVGARLARHAGACLARSCRSDQAAALGGYRLIGNAHVDPHAISEGGFAAVAELAAQGNGTLLAVEDTTSVVYAHAAAAQLGTTSACQQAKQRGYLVHSVLLLEADSERTLGLLEQRRWCRDDAEYGKKHARKQRAYEDKESFKWPQASERMCARLDPQTLTRTISVCDRESDIYEYLSYKLEQGQRFVVRAQSDRVLADGNRTLFATLAQAREWLYKSTVQVAQRGGRAARKATVGVHACRVRLSAPADRGKDKPALSVNVVRVCGLDAQGEALNWVLLTSEAVETVEQVKQIVRHYELRWRIEDDHKAWKSGVGVERLRQQSPANLERMLALTAFVAVRLLQLREHLPPARAAEASPPCDLALSDEQWRVLWRIDCKTTPPPSPPPSSWACLAMARLGGFLDTKRTGRPGWSTLWDGWRRLQERVEGFRLAREASLEM